MQSTRVPFLITTSNELVYAANEDNVLLLGEWCLPYINKRNRLDGYKVFPHYGLKEGLDQQDFDLAQNYYSQTLPKLSKILNESHKLNKSERYWEIIIGHWLWRFIKVCINRFNTIDNLFKGIDAVKIIDYQDKAYRFCPKNGLSSVLSFRDNQWNYEFFRLIIKKYYANRLILVKQIRDDASVKKIDEENSQVKKNYTGVLRSLCIGINYLSSLLSSKDKYFIISTYLPRVQELLLHITLGQLPRIHLSKEVEDGGVVNDGLRYNLKSNFCALGEHKDFELMKFIDNVLFDSMPISYVENFKTVREYANGMPWPKNPKLIFTANNFDFDEVFKIYAAEKCENGVTYLVGQHGGVYGSYRYVNNPSIEERTCDYFLTWGHKWNSKHIPSCMLNAKSASKIHYKKKGYITLIESVERERVETHDTCYEFHQYFESQTKFVNSLAPLAKDRLRIRLGPDFKTRKQYEDLRWTDFNKEIKLDLGGTSILDIYKSSSLIVHSYDSTGLLETLALNIPTIGFWETGYSHLRNESREHYKILVDAGILFFSAERAAQAINDANGEFDVWWFSPKIQDARSKFTEIYCSRIDNRWAKLRSDFIALSS